MRVISALSTQWSECEGSKQQTSRNSNASTRVAFNPKVVERYKDHYKRAN